MQHQLIDAIPKLDAALNMMAYRIGGARSYHFARVMIFCEEMSELAQTISKRIRNIPTSDIEEELADVALTIYALERSTTSLQWMLRTSDVKETSTVHALTIITGCLHDAAKYIGINLVDELDYSRFITPMIDLIPRLSIYNLHSWAIAKIERLNYRVRIKMNNSLIFLTTHIKNVETDEDVESIIRLDAIISLTKAQAHRCEILLNTGQAVDSADRYEDVLEKMKQAGRLAIHQAENQS